MYLTFTFNLNMQEGPFNITGVSNYHLEIFPYNKSSSASHSSEGEVPSTLMYFFDSGGGQEQAGYIFPDQVSWYQNLSSSLQAKYQTTLPALAFFHIPLQEYMDAWNQGGVCTGYKNESVVCQQENTGLFQTFLNQVLK